MSSSQSFPKNERMSSKKLISELFERGNSKRFKNLRLIHRELALPLDLPLQILISVPKKNLPRAVDRNKIKRRIREAVRRQKSEFQQILGQQNKQVAIAIVYSDTRILPYKAIFDNLTAILAYLSDEYGEKGHTD